MTSNPNYKPSEGKREEFRKYLEKTGVMDALTKVLVSLYEEADKPENAIEFICNKLANQLWGETVDSIRGQLEESQAKVAELEQENIALKGTATDVPGEGEEGPPQVSEQEQTPPVPEEGEANPPVE